MFVSENLEDFDRQNPTLRSGLNFNHLKEKC